MKNAKTFPVERCVVAIGMLLSLAPSSVMAQRTDEEDLASIYGDKNTVSVSTGSPQALARAPSVATVITAADIAAIGARDLDEVLSQVPGLHVSRSFTGYNPIYTFRGVHTQYNPQVLMLINGIPITSVFLGDRGNIWGGMPAYNIARIEIIRGPGSALYGADALMGVISIYTKTPDEMEGSKVIADYGSHNTRNLSLLQGGELGDVKLGLFLRVGSTDGNDKTIEVDAQTGLDQSFGTRASHAPGQLNLQYDAVDAQLDAQSGDFTLRSAYKKRSDMGSGSGLAHALDPDGFNSTERITADLTWHNAKLVRDWDFTLQASYFHLNEKSDLVLYPPGAFGGSFPDGMLGAPYKWERHYNLNGSAYYTGFANHRLRVGAGYQNLDLYKVKESKNFTFQYVPGVGNVPVPLGSMVDVSSTNPFLWPRKREVQYAYVQDEWNLARDWTLTAGLRYDHYSDFGSTTNPRVALVWDAAYNVTTKLMYGRAFRPPSFVELYNINNPVSIGNPDVKPEKSDTVEAAISWQPNARWQLGANIYSFRLRDILRFVPNADPTTGNTAQNSGSLKGHGLEMEASWDASRSLRVVGNMAFQHTRDPATGQDPGNAPGRLAYLRADWRFASRWTLVPQLNHVADRAREPGDTRAPLDDYTLVDLALRYDGPQRNWSILFAVRNLFDADAREPSPAPGLIQNDFPLLGRNYLIQGTLSF